MGTVTVPSSKIVDDKLIDLAGPSEDLCRSLNLLAPDDAPAIDMIKSNALALTKWVASLTAGGGGIAGIVASITAGRVESLPLRIALVAAAGLVIAATIATIGWIVATDVRSRAETQQARYEARSKVIHDYFHMIEDADFHRSTSIGVSIDQ